MDARGAVGGELAVRVRLGEAFTPLEAHVLHDVAVRSAPGATLDLDFRGVRVCHDVALLLLAQDIRAGLARYTLRGLLSHQLRLLGYLDASRPGLAPADPTFD